jgi:ATP-dependent Clp protease protease subunit
MKIDGLKSELKNLGVDPQILDKYIPSISNSMTPYILEEREMRVTQMDIFSRLMMDRIIWISTPVQDIMASIIQAQLMFLNSVDKKKDITMHINTPGGIVHSGLGIVDVMEWISNDVQTINVGQCASMGAVLLGAGTKGKRLTLPSASVMIHQVSGGTQGHVMDIDIAAAEIKRVNNQLFTKLSEYTGKTVKKIKADANRDLWLDAENSIKYGLVDELITPMKK